MHLFRPFVICLVLMFGQQMSGASAVTFFVVHIFDAAGTSLNSFVETIIVMLVQVVATIISALVIDRLGRKILYIVSGILTVVALTALGK
jgi:hypothetical protein